MQETQVPQQLEARKLAIFQSCTDDRHIGSAFFYCRKYSAVVGGTIDDLKPTVAPDSIPHQLALHATGIGNHNPRYVAVVYRFFLYRLHAQTRILRVADSIDESVQSQ